jgi:hypothetical protein
MDVDQITKLVGSVGLPGFIIVFLMVKGVPAVSEFSKQISALTNEEKLKNILKSSFMIIN